MATTIYVRDFKKLEGEGCDTLAIQRAIKQCWDNNYAGDTILEFESGKEYTVNKELCVYGNYKARNKKFIINGNGCTLKRTTNFSGSFGAVFSVYGLSPTLIYNPLYKVDKNTQKLIPDIAYAGSTIPASDITVNNLNVVFSDDVRDAKKFINGFAICNAKDVKLVSCTSNGAPQTNFAVNSWKVGSNDRIIDTVLLDSCISRNSAAHSFRLSAIESSTHFKAKMLNCDAFDTLYGNPPNYTGIGGKKVHLLCNVSTDASGNFSQVVEKCRFDGTGYIFLGGHCKNVQLIKSKYTKVLKANSAQDPVVIE